MSYYGSKAPVTSTSKSPSVAPSIPSKQLYPTVTSTSKPSISNTALDDRSSVPFSSTSVEPSTAAPSIPTNHIYPTVITTISTTSKPSDERSDMPISSASKGPSAAPSIPTNHAYPTYTTTSTSKPSMNNTTIFNDKNDAPVSPPSTAPSATSSAPTFKDKIDMPFISTAEAPSITPSILSTSGVTIKSSPPTTHQQHAPSFYPKTPDSNITSSPTPRVSDSPTDLSLNYADQEKIDWLMSRIGPPPPGIKCTVESDCGTHGTCIHNLCYAFQTKSSSFKLRNGSFFTVLVNTTLLWLITGTIF